MRVRPAAESEAELLTEIAHRAKRHWGYTDDLIELWRADLSLDAEFIGSYPVFCVESEEGVDGFYALSGKGRVFELEHMWVDPKAMGRGVGRALFEHALAAVSSSGGEVLRIASDPNAEGFYTKLGARRIGEVEATPPGRKLPLLEWRTSSRNQRSHEIYPVQVSLVRGLNVVSLAVKDLDRARRFYGETLGLGEPWFADEEMGWIEWGAQGSPGNIAVTIANGEVQPGGGTTPVFNTDDCRAFHAELVRLGVRCEDPVEVPGLLTYCTFYDPDGNRLQAIS